MRVTEAVPGDRTGRGVAPGFSSLAAGALEGPKWLVERRIAAAEAFAQLQMPTIGEDVWQYSRIEELDLSSFTPPGADGAGGTGAPGTGVDELLAAIGERAATVRTLGGAIRSLDVAPQAAADGLVIARASELEDEPEGLGATLGARADAFTVLADAFFADAVVVRVPAGTELDQPIVVVHELADVDGAAAFPRTIVSLGARARARVVELVVSGPARLLVVPVVEIDVGDAAALAFSSIQLLGRNSWQLAYQASRIGRDAVLRSFVASLGGDYARHLTQSSLAGENGASELLSVYLGDGTQVQDLRTFQEHVAPRTRSELVFKGAVAGTARSVYTGLIHMHAGAKRADASQTNRNLVLSEGAHADSVPNLDIEENDVRCSHASAVGPIDADQLFYLESRGVPPEIAERLILLGFFDDLLARAPEPGVAAYLRAVVAQRLAESVLAGRAASTAAEGTTR